MRALLTVFVPPGMEGTTFEEQSIVNGNMVPSNYQARPAKGFWVVDIPLGYFNRLIAGPNGKDWSDANPEILEWLSKADRRVMSCNAFPGEHRAPRIAPAEAPKLAPKIVRMRPPAGVTSFSHEGREFEVGADGSIEVGEHVAEVLKSHGFVKAGAQAY